jgi:mRNA interferase YafQ
MKIVLEKSFKKDWKRCEKRGCQKNDLSAIINNIISDSLQDKHRAHKWQGNFRSHTDVWEVHIKPDWLLLYKRDENTLYLLGTGTHADFVKK